MKIILFYFFDRVDRKNYLNALVVNSSLENTAFNMIWAKSMILLLDFIADAKHINKMPFLHVLLEISSS